MRHIHKEIAVIAVIIASLFVTKPAIGQTTGQQRVETTAKKAAKATRDTARAKKAKARAMAKARARKARAQERAKARARKAKARTRAGDREAAEAVRREEAAAAAAATQAAATRASTSADRAAQAAAIAAAEAQAAAAKADAAAAKANQALQAAEAVKKAQEIREKLEAEAAESEDKRPIKFHLHGYYRIRYNWIGNAPMPRNSVAGSASAFPSKNASYGYMRLRLDPTITYGPNPKRPFARLRFTLDGFDNVVLGDNARVFNTPLFSVTQSNTTIDGFDLKDSIKLTRAWIEFLVPGGQIRAGRMESHWGIGLLTHAGNGLAEWGDYYWGTTFDRVLVATRPITLIRGITKGDTRRTPLIYAFMYDRISQDPVTDPVITSAADGSSGAATDPNFRSAYTTYPERSTFPLGFLTNLNRRVNEIVNVLAWHDTDYGHAEKDEFFFGTYISYRWQRSTQSRLVIPDVALRWRHTLKRKRHLAITAEGEYSGYFGHSGALAYTGPQPGVSPSCPPEPCRRGKGRVHNVIARFGLEDDGRWAARLEGGWSSGDDSLLSGAFPGTKKESTPRLTARGFHQNVKVGLLMYQVALKALSYQALAPLNAVDLGANGSVWNSKYIMPSARFHVTPWLELHTQFLLAWASKLDPMVYGVGNQNGSCGFSSECFMGWEADLAVRTRFGPDDVMWIDLETGLMRPKQAFTNAGFNNAYLWTVQLRAAMVY